MIRQYIEDKSSQIFPPSEKKVTNTERENQHELHSDGLESEVSM